MIGDEVKPDPDPKRLYVGNVPFSSTVEGLMDLFNQAGECVNAEIITSRGGRSRGFAIVEMASAGQAANAIQQFNQYEFEGRTLFVRIDEQPGPRNAPDTPSGKVFVGNVSLTPNDNNPIHFCSLLPSVHVFYSCLLRSPMKPFKIYSPNAAVS